MEAADSLTPAETTGRRPQGWRWGQKGSDGYDFLKNVS